MPPAAGRRARGFLMQRQTRSRALDGEQRDEGKEDSHRQRQAGAERQDRNIEVDPRAGQSIRDGWRHGAHDQPRQQDAERSSRRCQKQGLGQQQLHEPCPARSKGRAQRDLAAARGGAAEEEIGDVGAGDEQDEADRGKQEEQWTLCAAGDGIPQRLPGHGDRDAAGPRRRGVPVGDAGGKDGELALRRGE